LKAEEIFGFRINLQKWLRVGAQRWQSEMVFSADGRLFARDMVTESDDWIKMGLDDFPWREIFTVGFGPFRRFTGGDVETEREFQNLPRIARVMSLFVESVALTETLEWLKKIHARALEDPTQKPFVEALKSFINQENFLPNNTRLEKLTVDEVFFIDGNGAEVSINDLSDGYRAVLSLTMELIRQLAAHYGNDKVFDTQAKKVIAPGIVLIDEVDAHLHPRWQRQIGFWLREHFPNIQFIVTTHSPLICQAAEVGSIFRLARPGTDETSRMVEGVERDRLLYGDLVDAYETSAIGCIGRSDKAHDMLTRLAELNGKALKVGLSEEERKERNWLRSVFPAAEEEP